MTSRLIAPVGAFAAGAYAETHGYGGAALASARDANPTLRAGIDAVFGADAFAEKAMTRAVVTSGDAASVGAFAGDVVEKAMRAVREMFGGMRDVAAPTLGAAPTASSSAMRTMTTTTATTSSAMSFGAPSAWTVFFAAGALTGCVIVYAVGPETCVRETKKAAAKIKASGVRAMEACASALGAILAFELPVAIHEAFNAAFTNARELISGASKQLAPLLKSSSDNLLSLIDASKGTTTAYAGKVTEFVGDLRVKYVDVAAIVVREKTIETYVAAKATTRKAYDKTKPVVSRAARVVREFVAHVIDSIKP